MTVFISCKNEMQFFNADELYSGSIGVRVFLWLGVPQCMHSHDVCQWCT